MFPVPSVLQSRERPSLVLPVTSRAQVLGLRTATVQATSVKSEKVRIPLPAKLVVGGVAGVVGTSCVFPLDMVKTRLQNQVIKPDGTRMYRGPLHCARTIVRVEGVRGLYQGLIPNLIGVTPEKAIKLAVNDLAREYFERDDGTIALRHEALSGAIAGFCQVTATNPMEITKIRMQLAALEGRKTNTMQVVRHLGIRGLYRGVTVTWMRDIPYSILFFPGYANLKVLFGGEDASMLGILAAGGLGAAFAAGACTPADVIKTRLQVAGAANRYSGVIDCFTKVVRTEGAGALFKGIIPRMTVQAPLFGIALLAFEVQKSFMKSHM